MHRATVESVSIYFEQMKEVNELMTVKNSMEMMFRRVPCKLRAIKESSQSNEIKTRIRIATDIVDALEANSLGWCSHACRMVHDRWTRRLLKM